MFDQSRWVSRRHAELRCRDGRWSLVDVNSRASARSSTGRRLPSAATVIGDGDHAAVRRRRARGRGARRSTPPPVPHAPAGRRPPWSCWTARRGYGDAGRPSASPIATIGRDRGERHRARGARRWPCRAATRRSGRRSGTRYALHDLGSFNGTLVNGRAHHWPDAAVPRGPPPARVGSGPVLRFDGAGPSRRPPRRRDRERARVSEVGSAIASGSRGYADDGRAGGRSRSCAARAAPR